MKSQRQRELAAAAEREAVDRGDPRLAREVSIAAPTRAAAARTNARAWSGVIVGHLGDVGAGDERLVAGAGQDHDARTLAVAPRAAPATARQLGRSPALEAR